MTLPLPGSSAGFLGLLAASAAFVFLGTLPILAAVGILRGDIEPAGRIVAFLFGAVFVAIGTGIAGLPLLALARAHGAATWRDALRLGRRRVRARADRRSATAAATVVALAVAYLLAVAGVSVPFLGAPETLIAIVAIEFIVIHGFPFFAVAAWFVRSTRGGARLTAGIFLIGLLALYGVLAWAFGGGVGGIAALLYLAVPNLLALAGPVTSRSQQLQVATRWALKFALFAIVAGSVGDSALDGPGNIAQGAAYFTLLSVLELFRVAEVPGDLARAWSAAARDPAARHGVADAAGPRDV